MVALVETSDVLLVLGRAHVVLVHFPIALLVVAAALEIAARVRADADLERSAGLLLTLGALAAVAAAALGWLHAAQEPLGGSASDTLERHRWLGNFAAGVACVAAACASRRTLRFALTLAAAALVAVASHLGGALVYGPDYFSLSPAAAVGPVAVPAPASAPREPGTPAFADVLPIFEARCVGCHGPSKQKGKLRLDRYDERWFAPGEFGVVIAPGAPEASEMQRRLELPLAEEDHMPPKKEPQLEAAEIERIRAWIAAGAPQ